MQGLLRSNDFFEGSIKNGPNVGRMNPRLQASIDSIDHGIVARVQVLEAWWVISVKTNEVVGSAFAFIGFAIAAIGLLTLAGQFLAWLKFGYWSPVSVATALDFFGLAVPHPVTPEWIGLQRLLDDTLATVLEMPFSLVTIVFGGFIEIVGILESNHRISN
jgi:hypothetical protein